MQDTTTMNKPNLATLWRVAYPWIIWALSSSFLFYKYLLQVSPSVMVDELMSTFQLTGADMGNLAAFYFYAYLCMQLPVGLLLDRFSPRRLVVAAIATCAIGALLFARANSFEIAAGGRLLIGLGGAFSAVGTMKLITLWFPPRRFALVSGLMMTVGMLGAVGGEGPLSALVDAVGWRTAMLIGAGVGLCLAALVWLVIRDKDHPKKVDIGLPQDGFFKGLLKIIKNPQSWLISIYSGLAFAPISAFAGLWGVPYLMENYHASRTEIGALVSLAFIGFAAGSPLAGWLSDYFEKRKPIMFIGTLLGLATLCAIIYLPLKSEFWLGLLLLEFGFFTSFFFVSFALMREINSLMSAGTSIGFINMFNAACGALTEPLIGKLLDIGWTHQLRGGVRVFSINDYHAALFSLPVCMILALIVLCLVRETHCRQSGV